jgi:putative addiction module killer protein
MKPLWPAKIVKIAAGFGSMDVQPRELETYLTPDGMSPFTEWLEKLSDRKGLTKIKARLARVGKGNLGDCKSVGDGVFELRIDTGPGYRVYFGQAGRVLILLLCGGDKRTQTQDIQTAKIYWAEYEQR